MSVKEGKVSFLWGFNSRKTTHYLVCGLAFTLLQSTLCLLYVYVWVPGLSGSLKGSLYDNGGVKSETGRNSRGGIKVGAMGEGFDQIIMYILRVLCKSHIFWI